MRGGLTARWDQRYASLPELSEGCDVPVRWSCRTGACYEQFTGLLHGKLAAKRPEDLPG